MTRLYILILLFIFPTFTFSQDCDCLANFQWVKTTFEENDAGFTHTLEEKGEIAYREHNKVYEEKVSSVKNLDECTRLLYQWLTFFRTGHIAIRQLKYSDINTSIDSNKIRNQYKDWEVLNVDVSAFENYLKTKKEVDLEGIWESGYTKLA